MGDGSTTVTMHSQTYEGHESVPRRVRTLIRAQRGSPYMTWRGFIPSTFLSEEERR